MDSMLADVRALSVGEQPQSASVIDEDCKHVLASLFEQTSTNDSIIPIYEIERRTRLSHLSIVFAIHTLSAENLIEKGKGEDGHYEFTGYRISEAGIAWTRLNKVEIQRIISELDRSAESQPTTGGFTEDEIAF